VVEWTQRWKEEGLQQGLQQGQVQEARTMVLEAVAAHFGETPPDMAATVQRVEDRETLHALLRQAITCPTLEAFREVLRTQAFRETLRLQHDFPDAHNNLGVTLAQQGKWEAAIGAFEQVLQFPAYNTPEIVYQNLGWAYYNLGRYPEAEAALTAALRLDPKLPITYYTLGLTWE